jgi:hypothetical protein
MRIFAVAALFYAVGLRATEWDDTIAPARAGHIDAGVGGGLAFTPDVSQSALGSALTPNAVIAARWGITDQLQLAWPLLATLSSDVPLVDDEAARMSITVGVAGIGWSSASGFLLTPVMAASCALGGRRIALVGSLDLSATTAGVHAIAGGAGVSAGFLWRLDDRVTLGFAGLASAAAFDGGKRAFTIGVGSAGGGVPADVPTVRVIIVKQLSVELWTFADFRSVDDTVGLQAIGANVTATWHISY